MEESPDGYAKLQAAFEAARQVPAAQRNEVLEEVCNGDEDLRAEVLELLASDDVQEPALLSDAGISSARKRVEGLFGDKADSASGSDGTTNGRPRLNFGNARDGF